jgi:hypothetical protein
LQEESVRIISTSGRELYRSISHRIPKASKIRLDRVSGGEVPTEEFLFERTKFLANCFPRIPEDELLSIATQLKFYRDFNSLSSQLSDNSLIWPFSATRKTDRVHIHYEGKINEIEVNTGLSGIASYYALSLSVAEEFNYHYPESSFEIYKYINTNEV